jgi:surfactin synthase thioesterase subunit
VVPSLVSAMNGPPPLVDACVRVVAHDLAAFGGHEPVVLVGHSGAGVLLPAISAALRAATAGFVFVDSTVPPDHGDTLAASDDSFREFIAGLRERDGRLPPWSEWWGDEVMATLIPDPNLRGPVVAQLPRVAASYFEEPIRVPSGWSDRPVGYLQLSEVYAQEASFAEHRGWPVSRLDGHHLYMLEDPGAVATALVGLLPGEGT